VQTGNLIATCFDLSVKGVRAQWRRNELPIHSVVWQWSKFTTVSMMKSCVWHLAKSDLEN